MALRKTSAEYFSHDANASEDEKIMYLETVFGFMGYALYFKTLERLCRAENFEMKFGPVQRQVLARHFGVTLEQFNDFFVAATSDDICAFVIKNDVLWSDGLKKRMAWLLEKRQNDAERIARKRAENAQKQSEAGGKTHNSLIIEDVAATSVQVKESKVKESKVKESKVKETRTRENAADTKGQILEDQKKAAPATGGLSGRAYPKYDTPSQLRAALADFYVEYETEWTDGILKLCGAERYGDAEREDIIQRFCAWAVSDFPGRTYLQLNARLQNWFRDEEKRKRQQPARPQAAGSTKSTPKLSWDENTLADAIAFGKQYAEELRTGNI